MTDPLHPNLSETSKGRLMRILGLGFAILASPKTEPAPAADRLLTERARNLLRYIRGQA